MATYTNLASLSGLQVGDVVNYTTDTAIDFAGYKVSISIYGKKVRSANGGLTSFDFDTSSLTSASFIYTVSYGSSLCYGSTADKYYRIAVGGDAGKYNSSGYGLGGGLTGGTGEIGIDDSPFTHAEATGGTGGSQSAGGTGGTGDEQNGSNGTFGTGGTGTHDGGDGWYGGGGGAKCSATMNTEASSGGGGGSGFVIGQSTSVYPSGYMGNDASLISQLESAVSNGVLTQGGSTNTSPSMTITVVSLPGPSTHESVKVYDSTQQSFIPCEVYYYNNGNFQLCEVYQYDNGQFIKIDI